MIARDRVNEETNAASFGVANEGYAIVPQVVTAEEIEHLLSELEGSSAQRSRAGMRHLMSNPAVEKLAKDNRMIGLARCVLGNDAFPFKATLFDKSPDANWLITRRSASLS